MPDPKHDLLPVLHDPFDQRVERALAGAILRRGGLRTWLVQVVIGIEDTLPITAETAVDAMAQAATLAHVVQVIGVKDGDDG